MKKELTKAQFVALLADYPDDAPMQVYVGDTGYQSDFLDVCMINGTIIIRA